MDLSQHDYGVSVLNDCKYGCADDGVMRLTLLKGSIYPDPRADMETHTFTYVLYAHAGGWREAGTHERALELNCPLLCRCGDARTRGICGWCFVDVMGYAEPGAGGSEAK